MNSGSPEIIYFQDNLFLNCPKCKGTAYLEFKRQNPYMIIINCFKCKYKNEMELDNYMNNLSILDSQLEVKCDKHNTHLDKFCYNCHQQFCSECNMNDHINCYQIKTIIKVISKERLEETKKNIEEFKKDFKEYINTYMNEYFIKEPEDSKQVILEGLIAPYIQKMIYFFHFCECVILNYNREYPDFYQQMNLKTILSIFKTKIDLFSLKNNVEYLFNYEDNNYFTKHRAKLTFSETQNNVLLPLYDNSFYFNKEIEIISKYEGVIINKNGNCIYKINQRLKEVKFLKINDETFAIVQKDNQNAVLSIFSTKYNEVIFTKKYIIFRYMFNLDNNRFGIVSSNYIDINQLEDKEVKKISEIKMNMPNYEYNDSILIPKTGFIATLYRKEIRLFNKDDFSFVKIISIAEADTFKSFFIDNCGRIFLGGYKIGYFDINNWSVITIRDDNIRKFQGYLTGTQTEIDYSEIIVTYFNRLVCKRKFKQIQGSTYDDVPNYESANEDVVYTFEFDPENIILRLIECRKDIGVKSINLIENNRIRITSNDGVKIYQID